MALDLKPLIEFGLRAEQNVATAIDVGGFLVSGSESAQFTHSGEENSSSERQAREEARPAAGPRQGSRRSQAEAAASDSGPHAIEYLRCFEARWRGSTATMDDLEELEYWYPKLRVVFSSSRCIYVRTPLGLFAELPFRADLILEIPRPEAAAWNKPLGRGARDFQSVCEGMMRHSTETIEHWQLTLSACDLRPSVGSERLVPWIRAWAHWRGGPCHGMQIISHHRMPDLSICACRAHQWIRGVHSIIDYIGMCASWVGKVIHEQQLGVYPGPQHYPEWSRVERNRPDEYCGCGQLRRYRDCHLVEDRSTPEQALKLKERISRALYFRELRCRRLPAHLPAGVWVGTPAGTP